MYSKLKISHYKHSGRLLAHEFTSYLPLAFLIVITGVILAICTVNDVGAAHPPPQAGSVGLTGVVPAAPPKTAANISSPVNGQHFKSSPITVSGSCPVDTLVELYKNNIFAGSVPCSKGGTYSLSIDLLFGKNTLMSQVYDALNQAGPASNTVTVYYDFALPLTEQFANLDLSGAQMLLNTNSVYRGTFPDQNLIVPITIIGGKPPYAINVEWGDASNKIIPRGSNATFNADHVYKKPGTFGITLQATDSLQRTAFLTVAAIVNGQPSGFTDINNSKNSANKLLALWPILAIATTMVISFWFGERREKKIITGKITPQHPGLSSTQSQPQSSPQSQPQEKHLPN